MTNSTNIEDFFKTVGEVKGLIENISSQAEELERRNHSILSSSEQDKGNKELDLLNNETRKAANLVRDKLKSMQKDWPTDENSACGSVILRIQRNQHSDLTRRFAEAMSAHHQAQVSFRDKCKAQIQRQLEIVDKVTTEEELEDMLQQDNLAIFISTISCTARTSSRALTEIERRHQEILSLEHSIKELHEILADAAMLLQIQGELINNIERNVSSTAEYVDASKEETDKAVAYKNNRYKVVSMPRFLKSFKRSSSIKTEGNSVFYDN